MIPILAVLGSIVALALLGAGIRTWTVSALAAALAGLEFFFALRRGAGAPLAGRAGRSEWWSVDRSYLLALAFVLVTLLPMPLALTRLMGRERYAQNARVAEALSQAADAGLASRQADMFAFTRNRAGTMRIAAIMIGAFAIARIASRLSPRGRLVLLGGLLLVVTAIGVAGIVAMRFIPQRDTLWWVYPIPHVLPGPVACFVNRNHFAGMMALFSPAALVLLVRALRARQWLVAPLWGLCFFALGAAALLSMSRGGFLAWLAGVTAVPLFLFPARRAVPAVAVGAALAALLAWAALAQLPALRARMDALRDPDESSVSARLSAWRDTLAIWRAYPVAGAGANAFRMVYPQHRTSSHTAFRTHAENEYLQLFAEGGVIGSALAALLCAACAAAAVRYARREDPSGALLAALAGGAAAAGAHAFTDFALHVPLYALALAVLVGVNLPPSRPALPRPAWIAALNVFAALALLANEPDVQRMEAPNALAGNSPAEARQALVWAPTHASAWQHWGYLCGRRGDAPAARYSERCATQAVQCDPLNYRLWQYLGYIRLDMKDYAGAREAFARVHALRAWIELPRVPNPASAVP